MTRSTNSSRVEAFSTIAREVGGANEEMIRYCDIVLGVLDGAELDSGTVSEIGFAAALGKKCYGLRTDFRDCGEFDGQPFNLQVLYWIESSGASFGIRAIATTRDFPFADSAQRVTLLRIGVPRIIHC